MHPHQKKKVVAPAQELNEGEQRRAVHFYKRALHPRRELYISAKKICIFAHESPTSIRKTHTNMTSVGVTQALDEGAKIGAIFASFMCVYVCGDVLKCMLQCEINNMTVLVAAHELDDGEQRGAIFALHRCVFVSVCALVCHIVCVRVCV